MGSADLTRARRCLSVTIVGMATAFCLPRASKRGTVVGGSFGGLSPGGNRLLDALAAVSGVAGDGYARAANSGASV